MTNQTRQLNKGFARDTAPPADMQSAEQIRAALDPSVGGGRGFLYEWEAKMIALDARIETLANTDPSWTPHSSPFLTDVPVEVKGDSGVLGGYMVFNPNTSAAFVQVFDALAADVTLASTPAAYVLSLPPKSAANMSFGAGVGHSVGITIAASDAPDSATGPPIPLNVSLFYR